MAENYHALQLLLHTYEGQVDCIYIDPPYNSGASDWKYNNRYIEDTDAYRHSKWLSLIEKRLQFARHLLKRDGTIVITIDENECLPSWDVAGADLQVSQDSIGYYSDEHCRSNFSRSILAS